MAQSPAQAQSLCCCRNIKVLAKTGAAERHARLTTSSMNTNRFKIQPTLNTNSCQTITNLATMALFFNHTVFRSKPIITNNSSSHTIYFQKTASPRRSYRFLFLALGIPIIRGRVFLFLVLTWRHAFIYTVRSLQTHN